MEDGVHRVEITAQVVCSWQCTYHAALCVCVCVCGGGGDMPPKTLPTSGREALLLHPGNISHKICNYVVFRCSEQSNRVAISCPLV